MLLRRAGELSILILRTARCGTAISFSKRRMLGVTKLGKSFVKLPTSCTRYKRSAQKELLTIFPQTGLVATFPIDPTDANHDGLADDLFHFAKIGSTSGQ